MAPFEAYVRIERVVGEDADVNTCSAQLGAQRICCRAVGCAIGRNDHAIPVARGLDRNDLPRDIASDPSWIARQRIAVSAAAR